LINCRRILPTKIFSWYIPRKSLSRLIISSCCRFYRRCRIHRRCQSHQCCRIPHYPIMSFQHCFVKPWAIYRPIPQLSSAPCYARCCVLPRTHTLLIFAIVTRVATPYLLSIMLLSAYSLTNFNPVTSGGVKKI